MIYSLFLFFLFLFNLNWAEDTYPLPPPSPQEIDQRFHPFIHPNPKGPNSIGYLYIGDQSTSIDESTWLSIKQGLEFYKKNPPLFILLELNTPGGELFAAEKISNALREMDTQFNIPIVAFINHWALSAGAMIAYSCRFITTVKEGSMGAAEPISIGEGGKMEAASEKITSAVRTEFANCAAFFDRNPLLAEAMVDKDILLVLREGKIVRLDQESQLRLSGPQPDLVISPKGKLLTLNAEQMRRYGVANLVLPVLKLPPLTDEEKASGEWAANKLLLFHAPFFSEIPEASVKAYQMDWKTRFFVFLATPLVSSLLLMGLMIGGYMELNHPGLTLPGLIAATSLFLIILSTFSLQLANWLEIILLLTGLTILLIDLFLLPTFGLLGILGVLLFLTGLFGMLLPGLKEISFEPSTQTWNAAGHYILERLAWLSGAFLLSLVIIAAFARYLLPEFTLFHRFVLSGGEQEASKGYIAGEHLAYFPPPGTKGKVFAALRPAGKIQVGEQIYDAISTGELIDVGTSIVVVKVEENVLFVSREPGDSS